MAPTARPDTTSFQLSGALADEWLKYVDDSLAEAIPGHVQVAIADLFVRAVRDDDPTARVERAGPDIDVLDTAPDSGARLRLHLPQLSPRRLSAFCELTAAALTSSLTVKEAAARQLWQLLDVSSDDEVEMLRTIQRLSNGSLFATWTALHRITAGWPDGAVDAFRLVTSLAGRGVIELRSGMCRGKLTTEL